MKWNATNILIASMSASDLMSMLICCPVQVSMYYMHSRRTGIMGLYGSGVVIQTKARLQYGSLQPFRNATAGFSCIMGRTKKCVFLHKTFESKHLANRGVCRWEQAQMVVTFQIYMYINVRLRPYIAFPVLLQIFNLFSAEWLMRGTLGQITCYAVHTLYYLSLVCSVLSMTAMNVER